MELLYPSGTPANYRELEALAEYGASPSFSALSAARPTGSLEPPDILRTGTLLTAFVALLLRILANRKAPICISRKVDILAAWKAFFGVIYIASAVAMLVAGRKGPSEWILVLGMGVVTAASLLIHYALNWLKFAIDHLHCGLYIRALSFYRTEHFDLHLRCHWERSLRVSTPGYTRSLGVPLCRYRCGRIPLCADLPRKQEQTPAPDTHRACEFSSLPFRILTRSSHLHMNRRSPSSSGPSSHILFQFYTPDLVVVSPSLNFAIFRSTSGPIRRRRSSLLLSPWRTRLTAGISSK
jgi:hypothetical protein